jgi:hypothetical protein
MTYNYPRASTVDDKQDAAASSLGLLQRSMPFFLRRSQNVASRPAGQFETLFLSIAVLLTRQFRHPQKVLWHALLSALLQSALNISSATHVCSCWAPSQPKRCHKINPRTSVIAGKWVSIALRVHWKQNR